MIDSHHHFWEYDPAEYDWINESMPVLQNDFLPENLKTEIDVVRIEGVVTVQASQAIE